MKILLAGAFGNLGIEILKVLCEGGHEVIAADLKEKENGAICSLDIKKASKKELFDYFAEVLPAFDRDRVFPSDVKKLIQWYNILISNGLDDFSKMAPTDGDNIDDRSQE